MATTYTIFRGDTPSNKLNLIQTDAISNVSTAFPVSNTDTIEVRFPGTSGSVVLSTANTGEVDILDGPNGVIKFNMDSTKSTALAIGKNLAIDVVVTTASGTISTLERMKILNIVDRANP